MFSDKPKGRIETGEMPVVGWTEESLPEKGRSAGRSLTIFKSLVLTILLAITLYGMLNRGLYNTEWWLQVAAAILALVVIVLFVVNYFADVPQIIWVLVGLLAALVAVKGLSLTWSISRTETVKELLRSSMYLATFALAAASLSSRRLVGPFIDGLNIVAGAVAGYGLLQKISPIENSLNPSNDVRVGSTLEYPNTVAVVLGMGIVLGLGRMTQLKNPIVRGLYAVLILVFGVILYLTFSPGGMLALGLGLIALFAVSGSRLQMFGSLLLVLMPLAWLVSKLQGLETFFKVSSEQSLRVAEGSAFERYLAIAVLAAFLLQVCYAFFAERYQPALTLRRLFGAAVLVTVMAGVGALGYVVIGEQQGSDKILQVFTRETESAENVRERLTSLALYPRLSYWQVAWEEWKEHPLTGTGAGTFMYTWQQNRPGFDGTKQVHNVYLEQATETGVFGFMALTGFALTLVAYLMRSALRAVGQRKVLLSALTAAAIIYLVSSAFEWHWYIPPSTIFFFLLAGVAVKFASRTEWDTEAQHERDRVSVRSRMAKG